eukprot:6429600-Pyramimonas_sp.AAC.1
MAWNIPAWDCGRCGRYVKRALALLLRQALHTAAGAVPPRRKTIAPSDEAVQSTASASADVQRQGRQGIPRESGSRDQGGSNSGPVLQGPSRGRPACLLYGDQEADTRPCVPCHDGEACEGYPTRREPRHKYRNPQVHDAGHDASQAAAGRIQGQARSCRRAPEGDTGQNQESGDPGDGEHERRSPAED